VYLKKSVQLEGRKLSFRVTEKNVVPLKPADGRIGGEALNFKTKHVIMYYKGRTIVLFWGR
jgi:hypothetical protein